jgi:hypothetical protein
MRKVLEEDEKFLILIMGHAVHIAIVVVDIKQRILNSSCTLLFMMSAQWAVEGAPCNR